MKCGGDVVRLVYSGVGSFSCNFCNDMFPNDQIELTIKQRGSDIFRPVYTGVGSFSLQFLLCNVS